jgi:hypothetical protein
MDYLVAGRCVEAGPNSGRIMAAGVGVKVPADCVVVCRDSDGVVIALNRDNIERVTDLRNVGVWERDDIQFPRLLAEIVATQDIDYTAISDSMDLSEDEINEIFERAHKAFEASKERL